MQVTVFSFKQDCVVLRLLGDLKTLQNEIDEPGSHLVQGFEGELLS